MLKRPENNINRPLVQDTAVDVMGEIVDAVHLRTAIWGKLDLGTPWRLKIPARDYLSFYVVARGSMWLELAGGDVRGRTGGTSLALSTGDAVLLPLGSAHEIRDGEKSGASAIAFDYDACPKSPHKGKAGGSGPVTSLIIGHFSLGQGPRNALLASLPSAIHLPSGAASTSPQLAGLVPLILSESASPGAGSSIVLARLADLLFVHALRMWVSSAGESACGLRAVSDP